MAKKTNPFSVFKQETKTARIEALDADIQYRELTIREQDAFNKRMISDYDVKTNEPTFDMDAALDIKYEKVSTMLIDPAITVEELQELSSKAQPAIDEILALLTPEVDEDEILDSEGN